MTQGWKKLLTQAFEQSEMHCNRRGLCGLLEIHRFTYRALTDAGIENRSPFNMLQILRIRRQSQGIPSRVRQLCIDTLRRMDQPAFGYAHAGSLLLIITLAFTLTMLLSPRTANTYRSAAHTRSILQYHIPPLPELDADEIRLPLVSDYQLDGFSPLADRELIEMQRGIASADWIQRQADGSYALQLLSASNPGSLKDFCERHRICAKSSFYQSQVKGKMLYRLLYGVYDNHQAAKLARSKMPAALQKLSPWARQFKQIKQEIQRL